MEYKIGSVVKQWAPYGSRNVKITAREDDIKNGRPGFLGTVTADTKGDRAGEEVWGYDADILAVITK